MGKFTSGVAKHAIARSTTKNVGLRKITAPIKQTLAALKYSPHPYIALPDARS
jgi:SLT domain-containing protein